MIFLSPQFQNSEKEQNLLEYLVQKSLAKEHIKEVHIAENVFGKEDGFDASTDSTVRVNIRNLRKNLENYYLSDDSKNSNI